MPQASEELRKKITDRFGSIDTEGPTNFLTDRGYKLRGDWCWEPKKGVKEHEDMEADEWDCLLFLVSEWDYGPLWVGPLAENNP